jgi:hypothetical protein
VGEDNDEETKKKEKEEEVLAAKKLDTHDCAINAVWLFTDGQANVGICEPATLIAATRTKLQSHAKDLTIFTFGFGNDHNANLLQGISETSQGSYYYIKDTSAIKESFADCLGGLLSVVAQNIKLELRLAAGVTLDRLMCSYPTKTTSSGNIEVVMKDLYSEEQRDILISLNFPSTSANNAAPLLTWTMSYLSLLTGAYVTKECKATVDVRDEIPDNMPCDVEIDKQRNRILVTEAMEKAKKDAEEGRLEEGRRRLAEAKMLIDESATAEVGYCLSLQKDLLQATECLADERAYASHGSKAMNQMWSSHAQQRCNVASPGNAYETSAKKCAKSKARFF